MNKVPHQARALFGLMRDRVYNATDDFSQNGGNLLQREINVNVKGQFWDGSEDKVSLTVLPGSFIDQDDLTDDSIVFRPEGEENVYEIREFREQSRSGHLGKKQYELKPYGEKDSRRGKSS